MAAISTVNQIAPVVIDDGVTPVSIGSIQNLSINTNTETIREIIAGTTWPSLSVISRARPVCSFTTLALTEAIDQFGLFAYCTPVGTSIKVYTATRDCGGVKAGSVHNIYTFSSAIVVGRTLQCNHQENCSISYDIFPKSSNGVAAPFTLAENQALTTDFGDANSRWTLFSGAQLDAIQLLNKRSLNIDFGVEIFQESGDSHVYDSFLGHNVSRPTIRIVGTDTGWFNDFGLDGESGTHGNTVIYLQKRGVAEAVAEHISLTAAGLCYVSTPLDGQSDGLATIEVMMEPYYDESNDPIVVDTTVALS